MRATVDGNEAAASVAYRLNEVCCIYPITPSSPMAELADEWSSQGRANVWGTVPAVVEMQSEGGAAGALHGSLQGGALATTFTASQGLLLMIPNMYKIAGELTPAVLHVAARSLAAQGLSIFGDHSDVMAVRQTGFALLAAASVQEAHDLALVAQAATLETRVPFVHFFDGFRTSHELNTIELLSDDDLRALVPEELVHAHRDRALSPERPFIRGTAQNPDVYFQARETVNPFYARVPGIVDGAMARLAERTGRRYRVVDYTGDPEAERVIVVMGSGGETVVETVAHLNAGGERVGVAQVRLYRPFPAEALVDSLPASVRSIAVLDRTKEPGSIGEPLFLDTVAALTDSFSDGARAVMPKVIGGRYGLSSKEFTPGMVAAVFDELALDRPRRRFTIGITDDVSGTSLSYDATLDIEPPETVRAIFFGLGSDGTVGANKNTIKILGDEEGLNAQGYFVYDSKKSGSQTVSHLRFGPKPIRAPYLVQQAGFVGCHQFALMEKADVLGAAADGATLLVNCAQSPERVWDALTRPVQEQILAKHIELYAIDAGRIAREVGLAGRTNIILQTCFFAISGVLPREQAIERIKKAVAKTYARRGAEVVERNQAAVDRALEGLANGRDSGAGDGHAGAPAGCPGGRTRLRARGHGGDAGRARRRAAGQRASGRRHVPERHDGVREAQHLGARRCLGRRHLHPVRQLQLRLPAQRDPLAVLRRVAARGRTGRIRARRRSMPSGCPTPATPCRSTSRTARDARCASRHARSPRRATRRARRSTSKHVSRSSRPSVTTSPSSRRSRRWTARGSTSAPCAARSSSSRCSSSPAPARAAARRPTSSCCPSCSAID